MMPLVVLVVIGVLLLIVLGWAVGNYNGLIRLRNTCKESWAQIDTELKRRYDLIPNLVETVKAYATHERETMEAVIAARDAARDHAGDAASQAREENALSRGINRLFAVAEAYPALKASRNFLELQRELTHTEDRIQRARRFYNANVRDLNARIEVVPSNIIAGVFGFQQRSYFEIDDPTERRPVAIDFKR